MFYIVKPINNPFFKRSEDILIFTKVSNDF